MHVSYIMNDCYNGPPVQHLNILCWYQKYTHSILQLKLLTCNSVLIWEKNLVAQMWAIFFSGKFPYRCWQHLLIVISLTKRRHLQSNESLEWSSVLQLLTADCAAADRHEYQCFSLILGSMILFHFTMQSGYMWRILKLWEMH